MVLYFMVIGLLRFSVATVTYVPGLGFESLFVVVGCLIRLNCLHWCYVELKMTAIAFDVWL